MKVVLNQSVCTCILVVCFVLTTQVTFAQIYTHTAGDDENVSEKEQKEEPLYQKNQPEKLKKQGSREIAFVKSNSQTSTSKLDPYKLIPSQYHNHPEFDLVKLKNSPGSVEMIHLRDAQLRIFKNPDGSFTKQQVTSYLHYQDKIGRWISFNGYLEKNGQTPKLIFIDVEASPEPKKVVLTK